MEVIKELKPIKETAADFDEVETQLRRIFRDEIYLPLMKELGAHGMSLQNAKDTALEAAIKSGRVTFRRGRFSGKFSSTIAKEIRSLGGVFEHGTYRLPLSSVPDTVRRAIDASEIAFKTKMEAMDRKLSQILPAEIAGSVKVSSFFDTAIWRTNKKFEANVKGITIAPKLTSSTRKKIATEWENNTKLYVRDFTREQTEKLRAQMKKLVFAGKRYEDAAKVIQKSYAVSENKAKFLARQETNLLMSTFTQTRYAEAGVHEYKWGCVAGSKNHPVRPSHKILEGKIYRWDNPPRTTPLGQPARYCNPGEDYGCRCFARPIVRFKK